MVVFHPIGGQHLVRPAIPDPDGRGTRPARAFVQIRILVVVDVDETPRAEINRTRRAGPGAVVELRIHDICIPSASHPPVEQPVNTRAHG